MSPTPGAMRYRPGVSRKGSHLRRGRNRRPRGRPGGGGAPETEEEPGWRPGPLRLIVTSQPSSGSVDSRHHLFRADGAVYAGPPTDTTEAERVEWVPLDRVRGLIAQEKIVNGPTLIALLHVLSDPARTEPAAGREP